MANTKLLTVISNPRITSKKRTSEKVETVDDHYDNNIEEGLLIKSDDDNNITNDERQEVVSITTDTTTTKSTTTTTPSKITALVMSLRSRTYSNNTDLENKPNTITTRSRRSSFNKNNNNNTASSTISSSIINSDLNNNRQSSSSSSLRSFIEWIQTKKVPDKPYYKQFFNKHNNNNAITTSPVETFDTNTNNNDSGNIYWISGLDRVIYGGRAMSEVVLVVGYKPPRYLWYMISGAICDIIQISTLFVLHNFIIYDPSLCWFLGFIISIPIRHISHRHLVFGEYIGGYYNSLLRMYMGYSIIISLSTLFNYIINHIYTSINILLLTIITMIWSGIANYFILKYFWSYGDNNNINKTNNNNINSNSTNNSNNNTTNNNNNIGNNNTNAQ